MKGRSPDDGYGVSTGYTYGYYRKLSPTWLRFVAAARGLTIPDGEPFRYFELGFGQGVSLNVHAASNPGEYWGNDYNPEHVGFARRMAEASGASVHLLEDSFEQLAERRDLPQFHMVVAHGIWSWISDSTRAAILKFLDERLAPGGLFYVSYNALPGSLSGMAAQRFLHTVSASLDEARPESERFDLARAHLRKIKDEAGGHFTSYPKAMQRLEKILAGKSSYYLHEYTVGSWKPELLLEVSAHMKQIGLEFRGSAYLDTIDLNAPRRPDDGEALALEETLRDFRMDRKFRSDLFVRSPRGRSEQKSVPCISNREIALTCVADEIEASSDDAEAPENATDLQLLLHQVEQRASSRVGISELTRTPGLLGPEANLLPLIVFSLNQGLFHPTKTVPDELSVRACERLNKFASESIAYNDGRQLRASPIIGAAVELPEMYTDLHDAGADAMQIVQSLSASESLKSRITALQIVKYAAHYKSRIKLIDALAVRT